MDPNKKVRAICLKEAPIFGKTKEGKTVLLGHFPKGHLIICRGWKLNQMKSKGEGESVKAIAESLGLSYDGSQKEAEAIQKALIRSWETQPVNN